MGSYGKVLGIVKKPFKNTLFGQLIRFLVEHTENFSALQHSLYKHSKSKVSVTVLTENKKK